MEFKPHDYQQYAIEYIETHEVAAVLLDFEADVGVVGVFDLRELILDGCTHLLHRNRS